MRRILLCVALLTALARGLPADENLPALKRPPLSPGTAKVEGDNLMCWVATPVWVSYEGTELVMQGGLPFPVKRTKVAQTDVMERNVIPIKGVKAYTISGKEADPTKRLRSLEAGKIAHLLKNDTRVFFFSGSGNLSAEQGKTLKEGSVILVLPHAKFVPRLLPPEKK